MEAEISGEDGNDDFALTVARPVQQPSREGRGECGNASYEMEAAMARWSGRKATAECCGCSAALGGSAASMGEDSAEGECGRVSAREGARLRR